MAVGEFPDRRVSDWLFKKFQVSLLWRWYAPFIHSFIHSFCGGFNLL